MKIIAPLLALAFLAACGADGAPQPPVISVQPQGGQIPVAPIAPTVPAAPVIPVVPRAPIAST